MNPAAGGVCFYMKMRLFISLLLTIATALVLRWQGSALVTPVSPYGVIHLEFAWSAENLRQLQLFWPHDDVTTNIYLDFLFLAAYGFFLYTACRWRAAGMKHQKGAPVFTSFSLMAPALDLLENFLMLLVWNARFKPFSLKIIAVAAALKFILVAAVLLFIVFSFFASRKRKDDLRASA